ncbi:hypothetical protein QUF94_16365 [Peribacillus sp. NJ4]|uniref:hypothetical protein n=1 Tax=Peribacillus TaxID=2675229 RepID=UPI0025A2C1AB|nr:hypothetical protein [Peribacillus sp. NJ4]MDM5212993.1 hypothetical protein [Peribacillus sp. NJ4]
MQKIPGLISILIPSVLTLLIINFLFDIVSLKIQGMPLVFPFILCPIGAILGSVGYKMNRDKLSLVGIIFNIILFLFPILYNIVAILTQGP